ncbi:MAG: elongation factor P [Bdellovibrio sp. CG12_big_fil_rev_8_21_14_0_65_39_13]|nr:MAG: elongation factor P [Bdellovibrio sp. CG22_combo_CG10-13_8_21_14_all_39_27]PIQ60856.1 MAG: elongation factor P [Bdellovibrio sp. CG12_big_fil_rev_8_21_14_0_65_39_13]PIR36479.1 MAG: elongation factor P [Bdellovibrio sp. CG11_big_fil_rev_8_21_14_0_20_39_38]
MEYQTQDLKKGVKIEIEGKPYIILKSDFTNPGKGSAFVTARIKNLETGQVIERTFKSGVGTGVTVPDLEEKEVEYMYSDLEGFNFMDQATFETIHLTTDQVGDAVNFMQEGIKLKVLYFNSKPITVDVPNFVELKVVETDPGLKGDTATGGMKKAKMETGLEIKVPLFIKEGEVLRIDTRTSEYMERVK